MLAKVPNESSGGHLLLVVQEVMGHVVAGVAKYAATVRSRGRIPVPEDECVCELPEGRGEQGEERRRHDKPVLVHGKIVMDAVEEEVEGDSDAVIREMTGGC
jgi:hypothetical protein